MEQLKNAHFHERDNISQFGRTQDDIVAGRMGDGKLRRQGYTHVDHLQFVGEHAYVEELLLVQLGQIFDVITLDSDV